METLKVGTKSNPNSVAGALANVFREKGKVEMTREETNISLALVYADEKFGFLIVVTLSLLVIIKDIIKQIKISSWY